MSESGRLRIERAYELVLERCDPRRAVASHVRVAGDHIEIAGRLEPIPQGIVLIAIGKAAVTMASGALEVLGDRVTAGIAITKDGHTGEARFDRVEITEASHPIPDERGVEATRRALQLIDRARPDDLVLFLISGGGSALFEAPRPPVTLEDMASVTGMLLRAGANISELNRVRTPLSLVKGGGLLRSAGTRRVATLILSDVLGNDPQVIASGPTVPGIDDPAGSIEVLRRYGLFDGVPASVRTVLEREPSSGPIAPEATEPVIVADNRSAIEAAKTALQADGASVSVPWIEATGEARVRGTDWANLCLTADRGIDCLIGGGEMTVTVHGDGIGGRNTEFALAAAMRLHAAGDADWTIASLATDGQDGPTDVAGAILDASDVTRMIELGFDLDDVLRRNDSLAPLEAVLATVSPGPTGTNVNDVYFAVRSRSNHSS